MCGLRGPRRYLARPCRWFLCYVNKIHNSMGTQQIGRICHQGEGERGTMRGHKKPAAYATQGQGQRPETMRDNVRSRKLGTQGLEPRPGTTREHKQSAACAILSKGTKARDNERQRVSTTNRPHTRPKARDNGQEHRGTTQEHKKLVPSGTQGQGQRPTTTMGIRACTTNQPHAWQNGGTQKVGRARDSRPGERPGILLYIYIYI